MALRTRPLELALTAALLAVAVVAVAVRMEGTWADGSLLLVTLLPALLLAAVTLAVPRGQDVGTVLLVAALTLVGLALIRAGLLFDDGAYEQGALRTALLAAFLAAAAGLTIRSGATVGLLISAVAAVATLVSLAAWIGDDESDTLYRVVLLALFAALMAGGVALDRERGGLLVAAAGITLLAYTYLSSTFFFFGDGGGGLAWGWEAAVGVGGLMLAAYALREGARGPAFQAFFVLLAFATTVAVSFFDDEGAAVTLKGWPLALLALMAVAALATVRPGRGR